MAKDARTWVKKAKELEDHRLVVLLHGDDDEVVGVLYQDTVESRYGQMTIPCIQAYLMRLDLIGNGFGGVLLKTLLDAMEDVPYILPTWRATTRRPDKLWTGRRPITSAPAPALASLLTRNWNWTRRARTCRTPRTTSLCSGS